MTTNHVLCLVAALFFACGGTETDGNRAQQEGVVAANETWAFIPIPGMTCAHETPTGIGLNRTLRSRNLYIYLEGGGGCWDAATCKDALHVQNANLDGFDADNLEQIMVTGAPRYSPPLPPGYGAQGVFDRSDAGNPFADYNFVYIPYCTGDFHMGNRPHSPMTGLSHVGSANMTQALAYLAAAFPASLGGKVVLGGGSAGAYGALWNFSQTQAAFDGAPVVLLTESGPALPEPYLSASLENTWRLAWGLDDTRPVGAPSTRLYPLFQWMAQTYSQSRLGFITMTGDATLGLFLGVPLTGQGSLSQGLAELRQDMLPHPNVSFFAVWSVEHTYIHQPRADWPVHWPPPDDDGESLSDWMSRQIR